MKRADPIPYDESDDVVCNAERLQAKLTIEVIEVKHRRGGLGGERRK